MSIFRQSQKGSSRQLVNRGELPGIGVHLVGIETIGYAS